MTARTRLLLLFCTFCLIACHGLVPKPIIVETEPEARMLRWSNAAVHTYMVQTNRGCGSGVAVSEELILTAWHVVAGSLLSDIAIKHSGSPISYSVDSLLRLGSHDAVLLHVVGYQLNPVTTRTEAPMFGEWVTMAGYPFCNPEVVVTEGAVAGRWFLRDTLVDGAIIPGMSGGPVLDVNGHLIGICTGTTTGYGRPLGLFLPFYKISEEM